MVVNIFRVISSDTSSARGVEGRVELLDWLNRWPLSKDVREDVVPIAPKLTLDRLWTIVDDVDNFGVMEIDQILYLDNNCKDNFQNFEINSFRNTD